MGSFEDFGGEGASLSEASGHRPVPKPRSLSSPPLNCFCSNLLQEMGAGRGRLPSRPWTLEPSPEEPLFPEGDLEKGRPIRLGLI